MFRRVAPRYDFLNHVLSGGLDYWWRWVLTQQVRHQHPGDLLDLATGSGDVLISLQNGAAADRYVGADFCLPMLLVGQQKGLSSLIVADGLQLPFQSSSFDAITVAFGLRNWTDRELGLREMARVLRPQGCLYVLEFSQPWPVLQPGYYAYLRHLLPRLATCCGALAEDYTYLGDSIRAFPSPATLAEMMRAAGFARVSWERLTGGVVAVHQAWR
jgi:demethylmenaquinone methyltransferase / 2-methoxy-6-polyprenyl-1,4-benzoquinol methylase